MSGALNWRLRSVTMAIAGVAMGAIVSGSLPCGQAQAFTLEAALAYAYANNPQLNAQRAIVRATDEGVPTALAGYRPRVTATADRKSTRLNSSH